MNILEKIRECGPFDSEVFESGWYFPSRADLSSSGYVAQNIGSCKCKVVVKLQETSKGLKIEFYVNRRHSKSAAFEELARKQNREWFERADGCGVRAVIPFDKFGADFCGTIIEELDGLYNDYADILEISKEKLEEIAEACPNDVVEKLPVRGVVSAMRKMSWRGWNEYSDYWDNFVANWYDSKACPNDEYSLSLLRLFANRNLDAQLQMGELPEPYYGSPYEAKGVIVNLNPGASDGKESSKFYPKGELVGAFAEGCKKKYSEYSKKYSSLSRMDVCGSNWWHNKNRTSWMNRFFGAGPEDMFVLEACPYHSKEWKTSFNDFAAHVVDRVVAPALAAASKHVIPCATFVGGGFSKLIAGIQGMTEVGAWRGTRTYELFSYEFPTDQNRKRTVYAVVINGIQGMCLPKDNAANRQIEDTIKEIISTGVPRSSSEVKVFVKDVGCKTSVVKRPNTLQRVHNKRPQKLM